VALRAGGADGVEYGVFQGKDGEPSASGTIAQPQPWSDEAREDALKEILTAYGDKLRELGSGVVFDFYRERDLEDDVEAGEDQIDEGDDDEDDA
jgi:hypothetical protein